MAPSDRRIDRIIRASSALEGAVLVVAALALVYRASVYWMMPVPAGQSYGTGDVLDFAFGLLLFAICGACAATGVMLSAKQGANPRAYRPVLVGITTFVVYYFVHPYVPRLF